MDAGASIAKKKRYFGPTILDFFSSSPGNSEFYFVVVAPFSLLHRSIVESVARSTVVSLLGFPSSSPFPVS